MFLSGISSYRYLLNVDEIRSFIGYYIIKMCTVCE